MNDTTPGNPTRREFLARTGRLAAASALAGVALPHVHAAENNTLQVALIGCGGRGSGAAANALSSKGGPIKLVAMADVFENRLRGSLQGLQQRYAAQMDVPEDRRFVGLDAYRKAMDCLKAGDIAIFATPLAFRWVHFAYAIQKGLHVFMEKPITADGPTSRRMFQLAEEAAKKNLKTAVGLMSRHSRALAELAKRIQDGELGEIVLQRGYRMHNPGGFITARRASSNQSELMFQIQRFHSFLWAGGGIFSDYYIHIIDHLGWLKGAWPVRAQALGARHYRQNAQGAPFVDQNFDVYAVEYTYPDGTKFYFDGRCMTGCMESFCSFIHGTKGMAIGSKNGDCGLPSVIFKGQNPTRADTVWESRIEPGERDPYQNEWNDLVDAIRNDKPYGEVKRGVEASLVTTMGRMAAHTGQEVTYEEVLNSDHEFAPGLDTLTADSPAPLLAGPDGKYPGPEPGIKKTREY